MLELITRIDDKTGKPVTKEQSALSEFCYEDGYLFSATDLGKRGVKVELVHGQEDGGAIILPPRKAKECGRWLLQTIGQTSFGFPKELPDILDRLVKEKKAGRILKRGDKKKIKDTLKVLKSQPSKKCAQLY